MGGGVKYERKNIFASILKLTKNTLKIFEKTVAYSLTLSFIYKYIFTSKDQLLADISALPVIITSPGFIDGPVLFTLSIWDTRIGLLVKTLQF